MIRKILMGLAAVVGFTTAATAATPVAVWDGDFTTAGKGGYTLELKSGGALPTQAGALALAADVLKINKDSATSAYANGAIVVKYSNYAANASKANTALASANVPSGSEDAGCEANGGILKAYWGTTVNRTLNAQIGSYVKDNVEVPASGYLILAYNTTSGTAAFLADANKSEWKGGYDSGIKWQGKTVQGFAIGGPRQASPASTMGPCATMTIEAVALFENYNGLTQAGIEELMAYQFTSDYLSEKYHNQMGGSAKVPAATYGSITVSDNGYRATALTGKTELSTSGAGIGGNFNGMFQSGVDVASHTVAGWFKVDELPASGSYKLLWSVRNNQASYGGYGAVVGSDGKIYVGRTTNDNSPTPTLENYNAKSSDAVITAGTWCYLALSFEKASGARTATLKVYKNGGSAISFDATSNTGCNGGTTTSKFYVGAAGVSVAGFYIDNGVLSNVDSMKMLATSSKYVVAALGEYSASLEESTTWTSAPWNPALPEGGMTATDMATVTATGNPTLTLDGTITVDTLKIVSEAGSMLTVKKDAEANTTVGSLDVSEAADGTTWDAKDGFTACNALLTTARTVNNKFYFLGEGANGATLDYGSTTAARINENPLVSGHLVFDGGTHVFKSTSENGSQNFGANATVENPTFYVKNGATLNWYSRNPCGWSVQANANGIVRIDGTSKIKTMTSENGTWYWAQQFYLEPGAELELATSQMRFTGGANANGAHFFMPASEDGEATVSASNNGSFYLTRDSYPGVGVNVGAGSTLKVTANLNSSATQAFITKFGAGTVRFEGNVNGFNGSFQVKAGTMLFAPKTAFNASTAASVDEGATLAFDTTDRDLSLANVVSGAGALAKTGTGTLTLTGANTYSGGTTVDAGTLKVAEGASIGTGNYSVAEGATLDLPSTFRPTDAKLLGTSEGTVGITLTAEELATFDEGEEISLEIPVEGDDLSCTIKVYDSQGTEHQIESATISDGKIAVQKKTDAKVPPFNLTVEMDDENFWESFSWMDSNPDEPQQVTGDDWAVKVGANIVVSDGVAAKMTVGAAVPITLSTLNITNSNKLTIIKDDDATITADAIDDSASTGTTTLDFATGTANIAAGANTVLTKVGEGAVTVGEGKTVTLPGWTTPANVTGAGDVKIAGAEKTTAVNWGPNGVTGKNQLICGTWAITAGNQYIGAKPFWIKGANAVFKISGASDILYAAGSDPIYVEDGGEFQVYYRDTSKRALTLSDGGKLTFDQDKADGYRAYDFYTDSSLTVKGKTPCVIGGLTAGSTENSGIIAIRRSDFTVTVDEDATLKCYSQWATADGNGGNFIKEGAGTWEQYRSATSGLPFVLNAGMLKLIDGGNVTTAGITVNEDASLEINATTDQTYGNAFSGAGAITKTGAGMLALTGSAANFTGLLTVEEGTVKVTDDSWLTDGKIKFEAGTSLVLLDKTAYDGNAKITLADGSAQPAITVKSAADDTHDYGTVTVTGTLPNLTVSYTPWVDGKGALYAWEFNGNLKSTGRTNSDMGKDHGPYYTDDNEAVYAYSQPYNGLAWPTEFTTAIACTLPTNANVCLVGWGKASPGGIALVSGDVKKNEVKMVYWQNNQPYQILKTMTVPNAFDCQHLYLFSKTADGVKVYLDGSLVVNYSGTLSIADGVQVGTVFQGVPQGLVRLDTVYSGTNDCKAVVNTLRVYDAVLGPNAIEALKNEFPYTSPNGTYSRALAGTENTWNQADAWTKTIEGESPSQVAEPGKNATVELSAAEDATVADNLAAAAVYEAINLSGAGKITVAAAAGAGKITTSALKVGANAVIDATAIDLGNTPIEITTGKKLTIDASKIDLTQYFATTSVPLTGLVSADDEDEQLEILKPADTADRTTEVEKNEHTGQWDLKITVTSHPFVFTIAQGEETGTWTWGTQTVTAEQVAAQTSGEIEKEGDGTAVLAQLSGFSYAVNEGTLKFSSAKGDATSVTVAGGATFDLNGNGGTAYAITLAGGSLVNTGAELNDIATFTTLTLTADSKLGGTSRFTMQKAGYAATTINLGGHTLTKEGDIIVSIVTTTINDAGTFYVKEGTLYSSESTTFADTTAAIKVAEGATLHQRDGRTLTVSNIVGKGGTFNNEGTVSAFNLSGTLTLTGNGTWGTITLDTKIMNPAVLNVGNLRGFTLDGDGTVNAVLSDAEIKQEGPITVFTTESEYVVGGTVKDANGNTVPGTFTGGSFQVDHEAKIGTTYYLTFAEALNAVTDGQTVTLVKGITGAVDNTNAASFTLDLNGQTITSDATATIKQNAAGTLTITDGATGGKVINTANAEDMGIAVWARQGNVVVNAGYFENASEWEGTVYVGAATANGKTFTITGGTFVNKATSYHWRPDWDHGVNINVWNDLTNKDTAFVITGGTFSVSPAGGDDSNVPPTFVADGYYALKVESVWTVVTAPSVTVAEFPVKPAQLDAAYHYTTTDPAESPFALWAVDFFVSFDKPINADTVALAGVGQQGWQGATLPAMAAGEEYAFVKAQYGMDMTYGALCELTQFACGVANCSAENDGTVMKVVLRMTNGEQTIVLNETTYALQGKKAKIGTAYYLTLQDAVDALQGGETVTLLADASAEDVSALDKAATLDLNGFTFTVADGDDFTVNANLSIINGVAGQGGLVIDGVAAINGGLDLTALAYAAGGLVPDHGGSLTIGANGTATMMSAWAGYTANQLAAFRGTFFKDTATGAKVVTGKTYTWNGTMFAVENAVATATVATVFDSFDSLAEAVAKADAGTTVTLVDDVELAARIDVTKSLTVDLGGFTITRPDGSYSGNGSAFNVAQDAGAVTIKNGTIDLSNLTQTAEQAAKPENECDAITARKGADVTLEDLTVIVDSITGADAYAFADGKITIKSGTYKNLTDGTYPFATGVKAMCVNQWNDTNQFVFVEGGTFHGQNPATGDDSTKPTTYLAEGYGSYIDGVGIYSVAKLPAITVTDIMPAPENLDAAFAYTTTDTTSAFTGGWKVDFFVSFDADIAADSVTLKGQYGEYPWTPVSLPAMTAGESYQLCKDGLSTEVSVEMLLAMKAFNCGVANVSAPADTEMTVVLKMYNSATGESFDLNTKDYTLIGKGPTPAPGSQVDVEPVPGQENTYVVTPTAEVKDVVIQGVKDGDTLIVNGTEVDTLTVNNTNDVTITVMNKANEYDITGAVYGFRPKPVVKKLALKGLKMAAAPANETFTFSTELDPELVNLGVSNIVVGTNVQIDVSAYLGLSCQLLRGTEVTNVTSVLVTEGASAVITNTPTLLIDSAKPADKAFYKIQITK